MPVKVAVRSRPLDDFEETGNCLEIQKDESRIIVANEKAFAFDYVLDGLTTNDQLYDECISIIVDGFVKGRNSTVLAYGQTGSGKTYTMGTNYCKENENLRSKIGVIPRVLKSIFERYNDDWKLEVSFLEIYNEVIYDILDSKRQIVSLQETRDNLMLKNLSSNVISNLDEALNYLEQGSIARTTGSTAQNENSSRSHAIFIIYLTIGINESYKLYLVDLAGSEGVRKSHTVGKRQREGININKGLLSLGKVLSGLSSNKQPGYIPYRDSVLTRMLKDSLNGLSDTLMIACVNPHIDYAMETMDTLRYASCAINIPSVNFQQLSRQKENSFCSKFDKIPQTPTFLRKSGNLPYQSRTSSTPALEKKLSQTFCPVSIIKPTSDFIVPQLRKEADLNVKDCLSPNDDSKPINKLNLTFSPDDKTIRSKSLNETFSPQKSMENEENEDKNNENDIPNPECDDQFQMEDFCSPLVKKVHRLMEKTIYPKIEKYFETKDCVKEAKKRPSRRRIAKASSPLSDVINKQINFINTHHKHILKVINEGSPKNLKSLPCIGEKTAQIIILHRQMKGPIRNLLDIKSIVPQKSFLRRFLKANCLETLLDN